MGLINDFLFGRKVKIHDSIIGELTTRIKKNNPSVKYAWSGNTKLPGQQKETFFLLDGNSSGPTSDQLHSVYRIIETLPEIIQAIDKEISGQKSGNSLFKTDWKNEYHLASIMPYKPHVKVTGNKLELHFEPLKGNVIDCISLIWDHDKISEIETY